MILKNKFTIALIICGLAFLAIALVNFANASNDTPTTGYAKHVDMHLDLSESFDTVSELKENAPIIAKVNVTEAKSFDYGNVTFKLSDAKIKKVYKGDLKNNTSISILETGGSGADGLTYLPEGNSVFASGDEAVVFLERYVGPVAEDSYVIKGVYQGKFKIKGNKVVPPAEVHGELETIQSIEDLSLE